MPSKSKAKGSSWELAISKSLSSLYGCSFIRTPSSGAYVGGSNASRKEFLHEGQIRTFKGDIIPPMEWRYFNAEAKFYKDFNWAHLLRGRNRTLDGWIRQQYDAADEGDFNIMFLKFNRQGKFICVEESPEFAAAELPFFRYASIDTGSTWLIFDYDDFLDKFKSVIEEKSINSTI